MKQLKEKLYTTNNGGVYFDLKNKLIYRAFKIDNRNMVSPYVMGDDLRPYQIGYAINFNSLEDLDIKKFKLMDWRTVRKERDRKEWANFIYWYQTKNKFNKKVDFLKYIKDEDKRNIINNCVMYELIDDSHIRFYDSVLNSFDFNFKDPIKNDLIKLCCGYNSYDTAQLIIYLDNSRSINNLRGNIKLRLKDGDLMQDDKLLFNYLIQACPEYHNDIKALDFNKIDFITVRANLAE